MAGGRLDVVELVGMPEGGFQRRSSAAFGSARVPVGGLAPAVELAAQLAQ